MDTVTQTRPKALAGQVAIVTGGRGIGRAMAQALAAAGASVVVAARSEDQLAETVALITKAGGQAAAITVDVTRWDSVQRMTQQVEQEYGHIDLLVNNAGLAGPLGPIWETDPEEWWQVLDVNLRGSFLCVRAVLPGMIRRHSGRIINVGSGAGMFPIAYLSAYCASKAALARLTECLNAEAGAHGIVTFTIDPGAVRTAMAEYGIHSDGAKWIPWFRNIFDEGRDVPPERSAQLVVLLATGRADSLAGCFITVDDDVQEMIQRQSQHTDEELYKLRLRK